MCSASLKHLSAVNDSIFVTLQNLLDFSFISFLKYTVAIMREVKYAQKKIVKFPKSQSLIRNISTFLRVALLFDRSLSANLVLARAEYTKLISVQRGKNYYRTTVSVNSGA